MFVPDQNQLHALYIFRCGELRVGKPNEEMLALLAEDDWAYLSRLKDEAHERGVPIDDLQMIEEDTAEVRQKREAMVPLAMRRVLRLTPVIGSIDALVHVGARGALAIVDVARELPFLEVLDFSNLTSLFLADPYQCEGVTGNDVIEAICRMAATHPSLRVIDLAGQPIGTIAAHHFLELLRRNRRIQEVQFDRDAVDCRLVAYIEREMRHNAALPRVPPVLPRAPSDSIKRLPVHDRKTVQEQQLLRRLWKQRLVWATSCLWKGSARRYCTPARCRQRRLSRVPAVFAVTEYIFFFLSPALYARKPARAGLS
ncbi:protein kinase A regulatory subunit [Trypanosoma cruzi]|uniref:Protein kinase A regulatory subunit n=1 Tax=Trypanosoma cruzi TaxID=5693 RepID=A0A2V2VB58_TRYCR|nr:protein kinase A regulatory subunit [Trypanosoma cruzi]